MGVKSFIIGDLTGVLFSVLPILLYYHYTNIGIGNERSTNDGNLLWERTGEIINNQWLKSKEPEILFGDYIRQALISNAQYFSLLQSVYDAVIFTVAGSRLPAATYTHSCKISSSHGASAAPSVAMCGSCLWLLSHLKWLMKCSKAQIC